MKKKVLFFNHPQRNCGVHQFGEMVHEALINSPRYSFLYAEAADGPQFHGTIDAHKENLAAVIVNYYPSTMPWLQDINIAAVDAAWPVAVIAHEHACQHPSVRWHIHIDPTHPECHGHLSVGRPVPHYKNLHVQRPAPARVTIGSFGFAFRSHAKLIELVNDQFVDCVVRLHIPPAYFGDPLGEEAQKKADACHALAKRGIDLAISHHFMERDELLDWLAGNTLNAFIYDTNYGRGPASTPDLALAVGRPIAVNYSWQFRHLPTWVAWRVEDHSLAEIIRNEPVLNHGWGPEATCLDYERVVDVMTGVRSQWKHRSVC